MSSNAPRGVGTEVGSVRAAFAGLEHQYRCFVGMQDSGLQHLSIQRIHQWLHPHTTDGLTRRLRNGAMYAAEISGVGRKFESTVVAAYRETRWKPR